MFGTFLSLVLGREREDVKKLKRLSGMFGFTQKDKAQYLLFSYPKNLAGLWRLDRFLAAKCKKGGLRIKRRFFLRRFQFSCCNLSAFPIFFGGKVQPHIEHTFYKNGALFAKVSEYNGWLEFDYASDEAREFVIECYDELKKMSLS
ncbi:MAG: hypothetical protein PHE77_02490 [Candidatus Pacebacteria bacterium]|nr:hypothetical protein [Candidatus Paceibacterota bacterium]